MDIHRKHLFPVHFKGNYWTGSKGGKRIVEWQMKIVRCWAMTMQQ